MLWWSRIHTYLWSDKLCGSVSEMMRPNINSTSSVKSHQTYSYSLVLLSFLLAGSVIFSSDWFCYLLRETSRRLKTPLLFNSSFVSYTSGEVLSNDVLSLPPPPQVQQVYTYVWARVSRMIRPRFSLPQLFYKFRN